MKMIMRQESFKSICFYYLLYEVSMWVKHEYCVDLIQWENIYMFIITLNYFSKEPSDSSKY